MTNNVIWANDRVKAGFSAYQMALNTNFYNEPQMNTEEQKFLLSELSDRAGVDGLYFKDDKPFAYKLMEETGVDKTEVISNKEDVKNIESLTQPPVKDETKEVLINGALVVLGVIVLVKLLS
jgi:hypothetical protein